MAGRGVMRRWLWLLGGSLLVAATIGVLVMFVYAGLATEPAFIRGQRVCEGTFSSSWVPYLERGGTVLSWQCVLPCALDAPEAGRPRAGFGR
jgi:hypothetical protein